MEIYIIKKIRKYKGSLYAIVQLVFVRVVPAIGEKPDWSRYFIDHEGQLYWFPRTGSILVQRLHHRALPVLAAADLSIKLLLLQFTRCTTFVWHVLNSDHHRFTQRCAHSVTWRHAVHCFLVFAKMTDHSYRFLCDIVYKNFPLLQHSWSHYYSSVMIFTRQTTHFVSCVTFNTTCTNLDIQIRTGSEWLSV